jgi:cysteine desulfurase/selenocysteine lyase
VLISQLEHHANIVPWQLIKAQTGIELVVCPLDANNALDMEAFSALLDERVKLVAITHVANVTGHITPVETIVKLAHAAGAKVLIDGCQAVPRIPVNVANLDCDFYVFSGHKCYGPTGIGVLYAKRAVLDSMPPWQGGGDMILTVTFEKSTFQAPPHRFEAGTPDISGAIALDLALGFLQSVGMETIYEHELALTQHAIEKLTAMPGVNVVAAGDLSIGAVSFTVDGVHPHDLATIFDDCNVAVRAGHHCAQPLMDTLGLAATARASFGIYNDEADVEALAGAIRTAQKMFGV